MPDGEQPENPLVKGVKCPVCGIAFEQSFWFEDDPIPTEEELQNPQACALIVCSACLQFLIMFPATRSIRRALPGDLAAVPPHLLEACRRTQRRLFILAKRREAQKIALKN